MFAIRTVSSPLCMLMLDSLPAGNHTVKIIAQFVGYFIRNVKFHVKENKKKLNFFVWLVKESCQIPW